MILSIESNYMHYRKDTEHLYHAFVYSLIILLSSIYPNYLPRCSYHLLTMRQVLNPFLHHKWYKIWVITHQILLMPLLVPLLELKIFMLEPSTLYLEFDTPWSSNLYYSAHCQDSRRDPDSPFLGYWRNIKYFLLSRQLTTCLSTFLCINLLVLCK